MRVSFIVLGTDRTKKKLRHFSRRGARIADPIIWKWAETQRQRIRSNRYPAQRAGATYRRTGNLANRWAKIRMAPAHVKIINRQEYAGFVVGRATQAWMHAGRWWVADDTFEEGVPDLIHALESHYIRTWRSM